MENIDFEVLMTQATEFGIQVIGAIVILIIGRIVAGILAGLVRRAMEKAQSDAALVNFASKLVRTGIMLFAIIAALAKFGIETTSFIAIMGAAGFAIGMALQGSLGNFAAGVLILVFKPFRIGDVVDAAGSMGKIVDIGLFTTTMNTPDNKKIIIPYSAVTSGTITNVNIYDTRRVDLTAGIGYSDDIAKAEQVLTQILDSHELILKDPGHTIKVVELADSSVNFVVRPWVKTADYWTIYFDVTRSIKEQFDANGISIPVPQQDVHMHEVSAN